MIKENIPPYNTTLITKVLFCPEFKDPYGTRTYCKNMMEFYYKNKIEVTLMLRKDQLDNEIESLILKYNFSYTLLPLKKQPIFNKFKIFSYFVIRAEELVRIIFIFINYLMHKPNLIHLSDYSTTVALAAFLLPVKSIYITHCDFASSAQPRHRFPNYYKPFLLNGKINILVVSEYAKKKKLENWFQEYNVDYIKVVYYHVGSVNDRIKNSESKGINSFHILTLGSIETTRKNPEYWIMVADKIIKELNSYDIEFVWAGGGELLEKYLVKVQSLNNPKIKFIGYQKNVANLYSSADIYFQPSLQDNYPIATIEAMKYGLPSIVSNRGGLVETIVDGESGFIVPLENVDKVISKFILLIRDSNLRKKMGLNARHRYENLFTYEIFEEKMLNFCRK